MRIAKILLLMAWLLLAVQVVSVSAGDKSGNGKDLYRQYCRVCHEKGSSNGEYSPVSLIQDQWKSFFNNRLVPTHKDLQLQGESRKLLEMLTPEQIKAIEKFCIDHAADSEQPQTCS